MMLETAHNTSYLHALRLWTLQVLSNYAYLGLPLGEGEGSKSKLKYSMLAAPKQAQDDCNGVAFTTENPSNSASAAETPDENLTHQTPDEQRPT